MKKIYITEAQLRYIEERSRQLMESANMDGNRLWGIGRISLDESVDEDLYNARNATNTEPTEGQIKAGNYKKGRVRINGYDITLENPKGSYRRGKDGNGKEWKVLMKNDYGYFDRTKGKDGDAIDVFIGNALESKKIFAVDQKIGGKFDETKVMFCFNDIESARKGYLSNYEKGWKGLWKITEADPEDFKAWVTNRKCQRKPFFQYVLFRKKSKK